MKARIKVGPRAGELVEIVEVFGPAKADQLSRAFDMPQDCLVRLLSTQQVGVCLIDQLEPVED